MLASCTKKQERALEKAYNEGNYVLALKLAAPLAKKNNPTALFCLGQMYYNGWGTSASTLKGLDYLQKAIDQGDVDAMNVMGAINSDKGNHTEAFRWYQKAAEKGNPIACDILAQAYRDGRGVNRDNENAKKWINKAIELYESDAKKGDLEVAKQLAIIYYLEKTSTPRYGIENPEKAFFWAKTAGEKGDTTLNFVLGLYYIEGYGVEKNSQLGRSLLTDSVSKDSSLAVAVTASENAQRANKAISPNSPAVISNKEDAISYIKGIKSSHTNTTLGGLIEFENSKISAVFQNVGESGWKVSGNGDRWVVSWVTETPNALLETTFLLDTRMKKLFATNADACGYIMVLNGFGSESAGPLGNGERIRRKYKTWDNPDTRDLKECQLPL